MLQSVVYWFGFSFVCRYGTVFKYSLLEQSLPPLLVTETVTTDADGVEHTSRKEEDPAARWSEPLLYSPHNVLLLVAHLLASVGAGVAPCAREAALAQVAQWFSCLGQPKAADGRLSTPQCALLDMVLARRLGGDLLRLLSGTEEEQRLMKDYLSREHFDALLLQYTVGHSNVLLSPPRKEQSDRKVKVKAMSHATHKPVDCTVGGATAGGARRSGEVACFNGGAPLSLVGVGLTFVPRGSEQQAEQ
jgi:hypothetical protein